MHVSQPRYFIWLYFTRRTPEHFISFNAFWEFLRARKSSMVFFFFFFFFLAGWGRGVNFWSRDFLRDLLEALEIILGFDFCPHSIIPVN